MKKLIIGLVAVLMLCTTAYAHPPITVFVDRVQVNFDQQPVIQNDRTLVPMRRILRRWMQKFIGTNLPRL